MNKALHLFAYISCGMLLSLYILILGTSLKPRVCIEYALYYIEKEMQDWPGYHGLHYELGTRESFVLSDSARTKRRGNSWNSFEEDGCWTYGEQAAVFFTDIDKKDIMLEIEVTDIREDAAATVNINGNFVGMIDTAKTYQFLISKEILHENIMRVDFDINNYGAIGEDSRNQGIKVKGLTFYATDER